jgi:hypothetical protein
MRDLTRMQLPRRSTRICRMNMLKQHKLFGTLFLFKTLRRVFRFSSIKAKGKNCDMKIKGPHSVTLCTHFLSFWLPFDLHQHLQIIAWDTGKTNTMGKLPCYRCGIMCQLTSSCKLAEWLFLLLYVLQYDMWRQRGGKRSVWTSGLLQSLLRQALIGEFIRLKFTRHLARTSVMETNINCWYN